MSEPNWKEKELERIRQEKEAGQAKEQERLLSDKMKPLRVAEIKKFWNKILTANSLLPEDLRLEVIGDESSPKVRHKTYKMRCLVLDEDKIDFLDRSCYIYFSPEEKTLKIWRYGGYSNMRGDYPPIIGTVDDTCIDHLLELLCTSDRFDDLAYELNDKASRKQNASQSERKGFFSKLFG
jgi:hypothetical protein